LSYVFLNPSRWQHVKNYKIGADVRTVNEMEDLALMGQCHEIFDRRFFFIKLFPLGPDSRTEAFLNSASYSQKKNFLTSYFCAMVAHAQNLLVITPLSLYNCVVVG
jgi:hypothetical protein